jgi:hypothetical protein
MTQTVPEGAGLRALALFEVTVGAPVTVAGDDKAGRRFIPIIGGVVTGEIEGRILPGGGDWQVVSPDRLELVAHYILETAGGAMIEVRSEGVRHAPAEILARLARGEPVNPQSYYFRTAMRFATGASDLAHLNRMLAIGIGAREPGKVLLHVLEVL